MANIEAMLFEAGEYDLEPETKVIHLVLRNPELLKQCDLDPGDFQLWRDQWKEVMLRDEQNKEIHMLKAQYPESFQAFRFMLDNDYVPEKDFALFCSQLRNKKILSEAKQADSLEKLREILTHEIAEDRIPVLQDQLSDLYDDYAERQERRKEGFVCLKSGHSWIDQEVMFDRGMLSTIAARPGQGKSSMALTLALDFAHNGNKVLYLALEMSEQEMLYRAISQINNVLLKDIFTAARDDVAPLIQKFKDYTDGNFKILSPRNITSGKIRKLSEGFDVVVVDQLSNIADKPQRGELKVSLYGRILYALKEQAGRNNQLVVLCAQINRQGDSEPTLINLKDSGAIEEASDKVIILHCEDKMTGDTKVMVKKNRQGQEDIHVVYKFKRHYTKFVQPLNPRASII